MASSSSAQAGVVYIDPFNYPNDPIPFRLELIKEQENKQYQSVWGPMLVNPGQRYATRFLEPGFYVAVANSIGQRDFFGLSLWNPTLKAIIENRPSMYPQVLDWLVEKFLETKRGRKLPLTKNTLEC